MGIFIDMLLKLKVVVVGDFMVLVMILVDTPSMSISVIEVMNDSIFTETLFVKLC